MTCMKKDARRGLSPTRRTVLLGACAIAGTLGLAPAQTVAAEGEDIVFVVNADISSTDPHRIGSSVDQVFVANVFESLTGRGADGGVTPVLASSYSVSEDGLTYDFTLREGVVFQNGEPFNADDVIFTWKRAADPELKNRFAPFLVNRIELIDRVSDNEVRIHLKSLMPTFLYDMSTFFPIVPNEYVEKVGTDGFAGEPVGTGPFRMVSRTVQSGFKLEANESYWGAKPEVSGVDVRVVPDDSTRVAMLMAGEADVIQNLPTFLIDQVETNPDLDALILPAIQQHFFLYNPKSRVWDLKVRQAIARAIDSETIANTLFHGAASPLPGFCLPEREIGCDGSIQAVGYDPEGARKLLEEAGFDFAQPLRIIGLAPGGAPSSKETVEAVSSYLGKIGVKTEVKLMETGALRAFRAQQEKDYSQHDLLFYAYAALNADPTQKLTFLRTGGPGSFHSMPEYDARIDAIYAEPDAEKREAMIADTLKNVDDEAYVLSLWNLDAVYGKKATISWSPPPDVIMPVFASLKRTGAN